MGGLSGKARMKFEKLKFLECIKLQMYTWAYRQNSMTTIDDFYLSDRARSLMIIFMGISLIILVVFMNLSVVIFGERPINFREYNLVSIK